MEQEDIFLVFVFLWVWPTRGGRHGSRRWVGELERTSWGTGKQEGGIGVGPQGALLSRQENGRKMKTTPLPTGCRYCFQKLDELEKNGNCSYPVGEEGGTARRDVASCSRWQERQHNMTQRNVRDPSAYLFVNEGDETG